MSWLTAPAADRFDKLNISKGPAGSFFCGRLDNMGLVMEEVKKQSIFTKEQGAVAGAVFTALVSVGIYLAGMAVDLDSRLDRLEEGVKILISADGKIVPSRETLESLYRTSALEQRIKRLEDREHAHR